MSEVKVVLTHSDARLPTYAKEGDAGADVYAIPSHMDEERAQIATFGFHLTHYDEKNKPAKVEAGDYLIPPGGTMMIKTGLRIELEPGWEMQVRSRSGMSVNGLVVSNAPGTIDSGYRGPCAVILHNNTLLPRVIKPGTRVAQFVLKRAPQANFVLVDELSDSDRGAGGFGSTGTK